MRVKFVGEPSDVQKNKGIDDRNQGAARAINSWISPSLCWDDIPWILKVSKNPVVLKGIQSGEDAVLAAAAGVAGIIVSNHGGRQLDTVLFIPNVFRPNQVLRCCKKSWIISSEANSMEKYLFLWMGALGEVIPCLKIGTDIYKAIALGAKAVGIGRPFLYAMASYGQNGVEKAIDILQEELKMTMRLMGTTKINDISADGVYLPQSNSFCQPRL